MRDWWTHTDLVLAGMWGGVAGVLPDLRTMFNKYRSRHAETPHWDQWFLRIACGHISVRPALCTTGVSRSPGPAHSQERHQTAIITSGKTNLQ